MEGEPAFLEAPIHARGTRIEGGGNCWSHTCAAKHSRTAPHVLEPDRGACPRAPFATKPTKMRCAAKICNIAWFLNRRVMKVQMARCPCGGSRTPSAAAFGKTVGEAQQESPPQRPPH